MLIVHVPIIDGEVATHVLTFWRNGFSIDDGELRSFDDPEQARILAELRAGCVPCFLLLWSDLTKANALLKSRSSGCDPSSI